jgi:hypothetical protein
MWTAEMGGGLEGVVPEGGVGQDGAEGEDVAARGQFLAVQLLRGHVPEGADDGVGPGEGGRVDALGDTEVDDAGTVVGQDDVGWLEVIVDQPTLLPPGDVPNDLL